MELWIAPLAGAAIGYFTNWLAVKMLFRPYRQKRLFGKGLPFTPGLIPKEQEKIARKIGETVSGHLLTEEMLAEKLLSTNMIEQLDEKLTEKWEMIKISKKTIAGAADEFFQEEEKTLFSALTVYLEEQGHILLKQTEWKEQVSFFLDAFLERLLKKEISELPLEKITAKLQEFLLEKGKEWKEQGILADTLEKSIWQAVLQAEKREESIGEYLSLEEIRAIKDYFSLKLPKVLLALLTVCEEPEMEQKLREKLKQAIKGTTGSFVGFFVDTDSIYDRAVEQLTAYCKNPENGPEIEAAVDKLVERGLEYPVGALAAAVRSEARETGINRLAARAADFLLQERTLSAVMQHVQKAALEQGQKTIGQALEEAVPGSTDLAREKLWEVFMLGVQSYGMPILQKVIRSSIKKIEALPIAAVAERISPSVFAKGKAVLITQIQEMIRECAPQIATSFDIAELIEKQVQSFDMELTEKLVLSVAEKELRAITWIGGILGFVIGCIPFLLP